MANSELAMREQALKSLHNKLLFDECFDERPNLHMKKSVSDPTTDYFNLDEINRYVTESFKNNESEMAGTTNGDSFCSDDKVSESMLMAVQSLSVNSLDNITNSGNAKLSVNASSSSNSKSSASFPNFMPSVTPFTPGSKKNEEGSKKGKKEKKSDWICPHCGNLNYSFRTCCNRCQIIR